MDGGGVGGGSKVTILSTDHGQLGSGSKEPTVIDGEEEDDAGMKFGGHVVTGRKIEIMADDGEDIDDEDENDPIAILRKTQIELDRVVSKFQVTQTECQFER